MNYCPDCGTSLILKEDEKRQRSYCTNCKHVHYEQLKVGAGALIERDRSLLLMQRTIPPFQGCWNLPAGYSEADESPQETAIREVFEETGLIVEITKLVDIYFFTDDPRGNGILIVYRCNILEGILRGSEEGIEPTFFSRKKIPDDLAGGGHNKAIFAWKEGL